MRLTSFVRWLLHPFGALYGGITALRNHLYEIQPKKTIHFTPFIISVGNLSVGGTGKTPMVVYLTQWLAQEHPLAILSRGYGRQTRGVRIAHEHDTARTLGDEPYLYYRRFGNRSAKHNQPRRLPPVTVAVGEARVVAVPEIMQHVPDTRLILLDDAYQHRAIGRDFNILLTSYQQPFYDDYVLPAGRLRESRRGAGRADTVVVTKCPDDLSEADRQRMTERIRSYTRPRPNTPIFFTGLRYGEPQGLPLSASSGLAKASTASTADFSPNRESPPIVLFSGLADPTPFDAYARRHFRVIEHIIFSDHHRYTDRDCQRLAMALTQADPSARLLTTEKDMVKLENTNLPIFYLPVQPYFLSSEALFQDLVLARIRAYAGA